MEVPKGFLLNINLSDTVTKDFASLTEQNIGKRLTILIGNVVVTSAIIKVQIDSGSMVSYAMSQADAQKLLKQLNDAPSAPCGYIGNINSSHNKSVHTDAE